MDFGWTGLKLLVIMSLFVSSVDRRDLVTLSLFVSSVGRRDLVILSLFVSAGNNSSPISFSFVSG